MAPNFWARLWKALVQVRRLSRKSYTYRTAATMRHWWNERLTLPGKYAVAAAVTTGIAGSFPEAMVGATTFAAFTAIILVALALALLRKPRINVTHNLASRCVAGSPLKFKLTVSNPTGKDLADVGAYFFRLPETVALLEPIAYTPRLAAGASESFAYTLAPARRGAYTLPGPAALSAFPFGLMHAKRFIPAPHHLLVYPAFHRLTHLEIPVARRYQPGGIVLTSQVGESMEFIGNREYQIGDRIRDLHIRSWARVGYPVVKQYQEEFLTRIAIILDTHSPEPNPWRALEGESRAQRYRRWARTAWGTAPELPDELLEANLALAAAIADHLARQEYVVDLFAAGPELYHFQAGRSLGYLDDILDILACIERCPTDPFGLIAPRFEDELARVSTVIAIFLDWDDQRRAFVEKLLHHGVQVKAIVVSDHIEQATLPGPGISVQCLTPRQIRRGMDSL